MISRASRLNLPPYPFAELARLKKQALADGVDLIDLGIGDPDLPTPDFVVEALAKYARDPFTHHYDEPGNGLPAFRQAVADWYERRFGVKVDPDTQVLALIGSKEGIGHLPWAYIDAGDVVLVPEPGYPVYRSSTTFAGGTPHTMPLGRERDFLPDLEAIPPEVAERAKIMWLNYPNNPTGAVAPLEFYQAACDFAHKYDLAVACDMAYSELTYDGVEAASFLQAEGGLDCGIEFHSFSKTFSMTGWRIGFAVGNEELISGLFKLKSNLDSGVFRAIQLACCEALADDHGYIAKMRARYQRRRDLLVGGLQELGFDVFVPKGAFYVWISVPEGNTSADFAAKLLTDCGLLCTPGSAYGKAGEGYIRMALTLADEDPEGRLQEAVERIARAFS